MSQDIEGARTLSAGPKTLAPGPLRVVVHVDPLCIEKGYNASGPTVVEFDAGTLEPRLRPILRRMVEEAAAIPELVRLHAQAPLPPTLHFPGTSTPLVLAVPTLECLIAHLSRIDILERALARVEKANEVLAARVDDAFEAVLAPGPDVAYLLVLDEGDGSMAPHVRFSPEIVDHAKAALGPGFRAEAEELVGLRSDFLATYDQGDDPWFKPPLWMQVVRTPDDWIDRNVDRRGPFGFLLRRSGPWHDKLMRYAHAIDDVGREQWREAVHARSDAGIAEAAVRDLGTPSQAERHEAGVLPEAELDALLGIRAFAPVLEIASPESRLDRDDVERAVRAAVPGATVAKVSFSTEEARGFSDAEWQAMKPIRAVLPEGMEANLVRTVAHVQTARDGAWVLRRPLVSLKARYAGRDLRARFDLGCAPTVTAA